MSSELPAIAAMSDFADASTMPAGMATSAIAMARTPRATNQRCSDLFTPRQCHSGRAATRTEDASAQAWALPELRHALGLLENQAGVVLGVGAGRLPPVHCP